MARSNAGRGSGPPKLGGRGGALAANSMNRPAVGVKKAQGPIVPPLLGNSVVKPISVPKTIPAKPKCEWKKYFDDDSGHYYYVNEKTGESSWDRPADYIE